MLRSTKIECKVMDSGETSVLSVITSDPAGDTALQLFEFNQDIDRDKFIIKLNKDVFEYLESLAGNRPISVFSICGQSTQGNSFLFSHIAKALEGVQKNDPDCTEFGDRPVQLNELKFGRRQSSLTQGIWVSRRPFIIQNAEDKEVAVLLMYTQGTDEQFAVSDDLQAIAGLSILMASVTIINCYDNLHDDILAALNTYVQYGLLALENPPSGVPFQQIKFLVQDWKMPLSYPLGKEGGTQFIKEALMVQPGHLLEAALVRERIQRCFSLIDCYLMPHAGDHVIIHDSLTGSVSSDDLDPNYLEKLVEFIKGLTCTEALPMKKVLDKEVTMIELRTYLEGYLQVYNSYDGPSAQALWEATLDGKIMSLVNSAVENFLKFVVEGKAGRSYLSDSEMMIVLFEAEKQAIERFLKETNSECSEKMIQKKEMLIQMLETQKRNLENKNTESRNIIREVLSLTQTQLRNLLDEALTCITTTSPLKFHEDNEFENSANDALATAIAFFTKTLQDKSSETIQYEKKTLSEMLESTIENRKKENKFNRLAAEVEMSNLVENHASSYHNILQAASLQNKSLDFDEIPDLDKIKDNKLQSFDERQIYGNPGFHTMYRNRLESKLGHLYLVVKYQHECGLREIQSNVECVIGQQGDVYSKWLHDFMKLDQRSQKHPNEQFQRSNQVKIEEIMKCFNEELNPYPETHPNHGQAYKNLQVHLDGILKEALEKAAEEKQRVLKSYQNAATKAVEYYLEKMPKNTETREFLLATELEESHIRIAPEAYQVYETEKLGDLDNPENLRQVSVTDCIKEHYRRIAGENKIKKDNAISRARNVVQDCKDLYEDTILESRSQLRTIRQLEDCHFKAKEEALELLRRNCPGKEHPTFLQDYERKLQEDIESTFEEFNDNFGMRLREDCTVTKGLLVDCTSFYNEEMKKHVKNDLFILPQEILNYHSKAKDLALAKLGENKPLTQNQVMDMKAAMEELFQKYNELNDMKLNINRMGAPPVIGIDLGTTYSCVGVYHGNKVIIIPFENGDPTMASYVSYEQYGTIVKVGDCAKSNSYGNPHDTIFDVKRILGRSWDDENLQNDRKLWPFTLVNDDGKPQIKLTNGTLLRPEQISAEVLKKCRESAESFLMLENGSIKQAVVTVPAYFTDGQRQASRAAAQLAGLEVLDLLNEPTAAAIAYYQERLDTSARRVLIFDMGGGTHDVAVLDMQPGKIESLGSFGDTHLGGGDFDNELMEYCCKEFKGFNNFDLLKGRISAVKTEGDTTKRNMSRIRLECEKKKKQLSDAIAVDVTMDSVAGKLDMKVEVTRRKFEELNGKYFMRGIQIVEGALRKTGVSKESIDDVVVVGGSSKIPMVKKLLTDCFKGQALNRTIPPDHAVAYGAAIRAAILNGKKIKERSGLDTLMIQEVIPFSLGIELATKNMSVILKKNSKIPLKWTEHDYVTSRNNQTTATIRIYEGEDFKIAANNRLLGSFILEGIPPAPAGREPIDVTMEINGMGILEVSAVVRSTKGKGKIVIKESRLGMSIAEVERILKKARNAA